MTAEQRRRRIQGLVTQLAASRFRREFLLSELASATTDARKESLQEQWDLVTQEQLALERALALLEEQEAADEAIPAPYSPQDARRK